MLSQNNKEKFKLANTESDLQKKKKWFTVQVLSQIFNFKYSPALILHESCVNHVNECEVMGVSQLDHCSETNMLACS